VTEAPILVSRSTASPRIVSGTVSWRRPDGRRTLQLVLATIWLLDGLLQMQAVFFTRAFGAQMIAPGAVGNPSLIARPIDWSGQTIAQHAVITNAIFALVQVLLGLGIAWRPTVKLTLAASIAWSLGVWWIGEGLGGVLNGQANPVNGAPGAVILYALLAVLLWPSDNGDRRSSFIAARAVGQTIAKGLWLVLWGSLSYFAVLGSNRSSQGLHDLVIGQIEGEPGWIAWLDRGAAGVVDHRGLGYMVIVALLLAIVGVGVYLPQGVSNAILCAAIVISLAFWVVGQDLGGLFTNGATDVDGGPLLILLCLAYWKAPRHPSGVASAEDSASESERSLRCRARAG
jgi:hypothetical protein